MFPCITLHKFALPHNNPKQQWEDRKNATANKIATAHDNEKSGWAQAKQQEPGPSGWAQARPKPEIWDPKNQKENKNS